MVNLSNLRFADDIVLFRNNGDELPQMTDDNNGESVRVEDYYAEDKDNVQ